MLKRVEELKAWSEFYKSRICYDPECSIKNVYNLRKYERVEKQLNKLKNGLY